jgi:hypothetical protein
MKSGAVESGESSACEGILKPAAEQKSQRFEHYERRVTARQPSGGRFPPLSPRLRPGLIPLGRHHCLATKTKNSGYTCFPMATRNSLLPLWVMWN